MAYKLDVKHPDYPDGMEFDLDGIAAKNGESVTVTEEMEAAFLSRVGKTVKEIYGHSEIVKLSGTSELSPKEKKELGGDN